jgi:hypothetical protein
VYLKIGEVKGRGNTRQMVRYMFTDLNMTKQKSHSNCLFYRLKQIDYDGKYTYSQAIKVIIDNLDDVETLIISPNPFHAMININFNIALEQELYYTIANTSGLILKNGYERIDATAKQITINNLDDLPVGIYILQIKLNGRYHQYKLNHYER